MRIAAYVTSTIASIPEVVARGRTGDVAIEGVFSHPRIPIRNNTPSSFYLGRIATQQSRTSVSHSQLFHGPTPRSPLSPLRRLSVRLRRSRSNTSRLPSTRSQGLLNYRDCRDPLMNWLPKGSRPTTSVSMDRTASSIIVRPSMQVYEYGSIAFHMNDPVCDQCPPARPRAHPARLAGAPTTHSVACP